MFTAAARKKAAHYWEASFVHPFITRLKTGELPLDVFQFYLIQDRYYLEHFSRLYLLIAQKTENEEIKMLLQKNAENLSLGEIAIRNTFFDELGITEKEIAETPIAPTAYHYVSHMYRQLSEATPNAAFAGMLPCVWLYQELGRLLINEGSPVPIYQKWIETYASDEGKRAVLKERELLDRLYAAASESEQEQMMSAFVISTQMELAFWEMAVTKEQWMKGREYVSAK